jgi:8-oxo-dGTP pyrophosphatase MutT (NUDIX family)
LGSYLSSLNSFSQISADYKKHFTASAVIIEQGYILLVHHKRIGAWLPPGGHVEENELPHQTAIREAKEETGLNVSIISKNLPVTVDAEAFFLPEPLCIHAVKATEAKGTFYHIDLAYLCHLDSQNGQTAILPQILINHEIHNASWVELGKLEEVPLAKNVIEMVALAKSKLKLVE